MNESVQTAIAALFCTSCLVRIAPAFVPLRIGPRQRRYLERVLPAAVFVNLAAYLAYSEALREPVAALASLTVVAGLAFSDRLGLVVTAVLGTAIYFGLLHGFG